PTDKRDPTSGSVSGDSAGMPAELGAALNIAAFFRVVPGACRGNDLAVCICNTETPHRTAGKHVIVSVHCFASKFSMIMLNSLPTTLAGSSVSLCLAVADTLPIGISSFESAL